MCKIKNKLLTGLLAILPFMAQAQDLNISGVLLDGNNEPVVGATVVVKGTANGVTTGINGDYNITAPADAILVFSMIGMAAVEEAVNGRGRVDIIMSEDARAIDEVIVVGYGTQKKATLTGAVAGVRGQDMITTKNENTQNMLTGKIAGVRVWQRSAEPGTYQANFDIRGLGAPLVIIDGIPRTTEEFQRLSANDIEDVSVLKDASAAIYGVRAANGVLLVTTKRGSRGEGKASVAYSGSYTMQQPSGMPVVANAAQTMEIYNAKILNNINGGTPTYLQADFDAYATGAKRADDWNALMFADFSPQTQHDISITGGGDKVQYYVGMGYFYQEGFFKSGDMNYNKFNLRSNISAEVVKGLKFDLNLAGIADERNTPYTGAVDLIRSWWRQGVLFPAYADPARTMLNYEGLELEDNPVAAMTSSVSGYRKYQQKYFQSAATLSYDFGTVTSYLQGLSVKGLFNFDYRMDDNTHFRKEYYQYRHNSQTNAYEAKLYDASSPNSLRREMFTKQQTLGQFLLNYDRTFADKHKVNALIGYETQRRIGDNFYALRELAFGVDYLFAGTEENQLGGMNTGDNDIYEMAYGAMIGRLNYAYGDRYIIEGQFRYDGTSKFLPGHQWGFFPSVSGAWRISEEPLFKSISALSFVNQLKVRASYGIVGDDGYNANSWAKDWVTGYIYPATGDNAEKGYYNHWAPGYIIDGRFVTTVSTTAIPNYEITWFTSRTFDFGVDFEAWKGLFGFSFDWFSRRREGLFARSTGDLPTAVGNTAPRENLDSDRDFGIDLELSHKNTVNGFTYKVKAIGTITRRMHMHASEKGPWGNSYDEWRNDNLNNRYQGVQFGYEGAGRYTSWKDIQEYNVQHGAGTLPGDYKYLDWNGDGEINGLDEHPYAYDQTPWLNYSLNLECGWKGLDLSILLQGSALGSMSYSEPLYAIWGSNGGGVLTQYLDRWHPVTANPWDQIDPYDPNLTWVEGHYGYTGHYPMQNSTFNRVSTAYLRLKSVELGYTLPKFKGAASAFGMRVFVNAYNLLTFTGVKFVDPEHPDSDNGRLYPLNKTYTVGLQLQF